MSVATELGKVLQGSKVDPRNPLRDGSVAAAAMLPKVRSCSCHLLNLHVLVELVPWRHGWTASGVKRTHPGSATSFHHWSKYKHVVTYIGCYTFTSHC